MKPEERIKACLMLRKYLSGIIEDAKLEIHKENLKNAKTCSGGFHD